MAAPSSRCKPESKLSDGMEVSVWLTGRPRPFVPAKHVGTLNASMMPNGTAKPTKNRKSFQNNG